MGDHTIGVTAGFCDCTHTNTSVGARCIEKINVRALNSGNMWPASTLHKAERIQHTAHMLGIRRNLTAQSLIF